MNGPGPAPVLLTDGVWRCTVAAVRDLGGRGIPVTVAYDDWAAPARWSRYATRAVPCPPTNQPERFLEWLHDFGTRQPGHVLCPSSDDVAFLAATHRESLGRLFHLLVPPPEALLAVIDKGRLGEAAARAGLSSPQTWSPGDEDEVAALAPDLPLPLLVKPRTPILSRVSQKILRVDRRQDLVAAWRRARAANAHQELATGVAGIGLPLIQRCHDGLERIYTLDGFVDPTGRIVAAAACVKRLQMPRRSGVGVCFEPAALDPVLLSGLERLCRQTGHVGVFDAEFLVDGDERLLIDLNPRFYGHMAFEVDRGLPLPWMAYRAALQDWEGVAAAVTPVNGVDPRLRGRYVHRFPTAVMLATQLAARNMTAAEVRRWLRWMAHSGSPHTDPVYVRGDPLPAIADIVQSLRHPRSFVRKAAAP